MSKWLEIDYTVSGGAGDYWHIDATATNENVNPSYLTNWYTVNSAQFSYTYLGGLNRNNTDNKVDKGKYVVAVGCRRVIAFTSGTAKVSIYDSSSKNVLYDQKTVTLTNDIAQNVTLHVNVGSPDGTPTYLETLDKLDQWSSAQYIPDMRNSRNELNL